MKEEYEVFECEKIGANVRIGRPILEHKDGSTNQYVYQLKMSACSCDHFRKCGIFIDKGSFMKPDWSKCPHPELTALSENE